MRIAVIVTLAAAVVSVAGLAGCSKTNCERGSHHVFDLLAHPFPGDRDPKGDKPIPPPSAEEQAVMDQVASASIGVCEREGLSDAQLACLLAMHSLTDFEAVVDCPAIAAAKPSWLIAGPPPTPPPVPPTPDPAPSP